MSRIKFKMGPAAGLEIATSGFLTVVMPKHMYYSRHQRFCSAICARIGLRVMASFSKKKTMNTEFYSTENNKSNLITSVPYIIYNTGRINVILQKKRKIAQLSIISLLNKPVQKSENLEPMCHCKRLLI